MTELPILVAIILFLSWVRIKILAYQEASVPMKTCVHCMFGPEGKRAYACQYKFSDNGDLSSLIRKGRTGCKKIQ